MSSALVSDGLARPLPRILRVITLGLACALAAVCARAQTAAGTGSISGRVYNPANKEYVRNVEVSVAGTTQTVLTADDGTYHLLNVPAGAQTVRATYEGADIAPATVEVAPGANATVDFTLSGAGVKANANGVMTLDTFSVSAERSGAAKMIQEEKESMKISKIVASETFGNQPEGNVGEFLKFLPAIQMDYVEADARTPRIRGLPAQYTSVTYDEMSIASADGFIQNNGTDNGGGAGAGDRSFGFEQVSMSNVDSIEVSYTTTAGQDASSPAGNINLRPKHAFDRSEQAINFSVQLMADSEAMYLNKKLSPDDSPNYQYRPNASLEYLNSFFNHKLGVVVSLSSADTNHMQRQFAPTYDSTPTAADPRPLVLTGLIYKDGPTITKRQTGSFTIDYKLTDALSVSLLGVWTGYQSWIGNHTWGVTTTRANVGGDGLSSWSNVPITGTSNTMQDLLKRTYGHSLLPTFEYKSGPWDVQGKASFSQSINNYNGGISKSFPGLTASGTSISTTGMTVNATHPADNNYAWSINEVTGLDWATLSNYKASATATPTVTEDGRYAKNLVDQGLLQARYTANWSMPTWFEVGAKSTETTFVYQNPTSYQIWNYVGPGGGLGGSWASFPSSFDFAPGNGASFNSISGGQPAVQNHNQIGQTFKSDPEYFVPAGTAAQYLIAYVQNPRYVREEVDAGDAMFDVKPISKMELQAGVRYEKTRDELKNFQSLPTSAVEAAGYAVTASTGIASTIPGIQYQYFSKPRSATSTEYNALFPNGSIKYAIRPNLIALLGYSYTVTRPSYNDISGVVTIDDDTQTITFPNTKIKPQYANNYSGTLYYYMKHLGVLGLGVFENDFKNYTQSQTLPAGSAANYGFTDPQYANYVVTTKINLPGTVIYRGATLEYSQALNFLPGYLADFNVFANYTRIYTRINGIPLATLNQATPYNYGWLPGVAPNVVNYGASWKHGRLNLHVNARFTDKEPYSATYNVYQKQNTKVDLGASYAMTDHLSVIFSARNIFDTPDYDFFGNNTQWIRSTGARGIEYYGAYYYMGIQGKY